MDLQSLTKITDYLGKESRRTPPSNFGVNMTCKLPTPSLIIEGLASHLCNRGLHEDFDVCVRVELERIKLPISYAVQTSKHPNVGEICRRTRAFADLTRADLVEMATVFRELTEAIDYQNVCQRSIARSRLAT